MTLHELHPYLEDLETRIDASVEADLFGSWVKFAAGEWPEDLFDPRRPGPRPPGVHWPEIVLNKTFDDPVLMLLHQLSVNSRILTAGTGELLGIRANYGTPTIPSMYGVRLYLMPAEMNTLPTCYPLPDGLDGALRRLAQGAPTLRDGLVPRVMETGEMFRDALRPYPKVTRHLAIYHPDFQGPMDICELLVGTALFTELIDRPEDVHSLLRSITATYRMCMSRWQEIFPPSEEWNVHWNMLHRGSIMVRDDSATNLSPSMFAEFIAPYDRELLQFFGGGAIHFCGRGDRFIGIAAGMPGLHAIHMSQPELNDLETMCVHTIDQGLFLIGVKREGTRMLREAGRPLKGRVHCWDGIPK